MGIPVKRFEVIALSVSGRRNKVLSRGDIVRETDFPAGNAEELVKKGFLRYFDTIELNELVLRNHRPRPHRSGRFRHHRANMTPSQAIHIFNNAEKTDIPLKRKPNPALSVVIPYFRAGFIGWLPLESLIRQEGVSFEWELLIIEEDFDNPFGLDRVLEYEDRLKQVGCSRILYTQLSDWLPLSSKWFFLYHQVSDSSDIIACNSADIYMSRHRLARQFAVMSRGNCNWFKLSGNLVFDIATETHVKIEAMSPNRPDTCCRAIAKTLAHHMPLDCIRRSVDGWSYSVMSQHGIDYHYDQSDLSHDTVNVNGLNNISLHRARRIKKLEPPMSACCDKLEDHIPIEIVIKLKEAKAKVVEHTQNIRSSRVKL